MDYTFVTISQEEELKTKRCIIGWNKFVLLQEHLCPVVHRSTGRRERHENIFKNGDKISHNERTSVYRLKGLAIEPKAKRYTPKPEVSTEKLSPKENETKLKSAE